MNTKVASSYLTELVLHNKTRGDHTQLFSYLSHWRSIMENAISDDYPIHLPREEIARIPLERRKTPSLFFLQRLFDAHDIKLYQVISDTNNYYRAILGTESMPPMMKFSQESFEDWMLMKTLREIMDGLRLESIRDTTNMFSGSGTPFWYKIVQKSSNIHENIYSLDFCSLLPNGNRVDSNFFGNLDDKMSKLTINQ